MMEIGNVCFAPTDRPASTAAPALSGDAFLVLLIAQLRAQDPFKPMDPAQMVGELVQFNLLDHMIRIRQAIEANGAPAPRSIQASTPQR